MKIFLTYTFLILFVIVSCKQSELTPIKKSSEISKPAKFATSTITDKNGFKYKTVDGDPFNVREYQLANGLKVFLSENKEKPEISTMIAVRAGSTYDPKETTGLAHYLEHLVFKGTDKYGTTNWEEEKKLLEQISQKFEEHKMTDDEDEKKKIYTEIDNLSQEASKYAIFQEYKKMVSSIGAKGTNAFTSTEQTVYVNTIPSNQIDKWLTLESERFSSLVLRLFHTELETVYEEFNAGQSSDMRQLLYKFQNLLFPTHPYGTQTTLGKPEHLKNPSMVNIHNYWKKYYVANNMAIIMTGDLDFDDTIVKIDKHFGKLRRDDNLSHPTFPKEKEITTPVKEEVFGPEAESVMIGFRTEGVNNDENIIAELIGMILYNGQAGLIDIELVKKQKVLSAYSYNSISKDYGSFVLYGTPLEGQTLEEVEELLLSQIERIKNGDFEDWLQDAIINAEKLSQLRKIEYNHYIYSILRSFIQGEEWADNTSRLDKMENITRQQIIDYANKTFKDNYVVVYKRKGESKKSVTVDKPEITSIENDRTKESEYYREFIDLPETHLKPEFVNYKDMIKTKSFNGAEFNYIKNKNNELTTLNIIVEVGSYNIQELKIAFNYFEYAGTENYSAEDLAKEYYKLGVYTGVSASSDRSYIYLSGLDKNFPKALNLFIENLKTAKFDENSFKNYIDQMKKGRMNSKLSKRTIGSSLSTYAKYGKDNPARYNLTNEELDKIDSKKIMSLINEILDYKHKILYYGPKEFDSAYDLLSAAYTPSTTLKDFPAKKEFEELENSSKIYFTNYDMVQSKISLFAKGEKFNEENYAFSRMFNEFYGIGLSSILLQELRESKGLVYSAYSYLSIPSERKKSHYLWGSMQTQPDKMIEAMTAMTDILNKIPEARKQFEDTRRAILRKIESKRVTKSSPFWNYLSNQKLGIDYNIDEVVYNKIKTMTYEEFEAFFNEHIANKKFDMTIMGKKEDIDFEKLKQFGEIIEVPLDDLFNH